MGATTTSYGRPVWVDLSTPDLEGASRFYAELLGWTVEEHRSPMGTYVIGSADGHEVGGMMATPPGEDVAPPAWTVLIEVADVDATVATVERAGGSVLEPPFDLAAARLAIVADPTGATFGVIAQQEPPEAWRSATPGAVCWVELLTRDPDRAARFYAAVFGWGASTDTYGDLPYTSFTLDGEAVAGAMPMPAEVPAELAAVWSVSFAVDDCAEVERRAVALGGEVARSTSPIGTGRFAVLADPQGATFQVMDAAG